MQITAVSEILAAKMEGDRSYLIVFAADSGTYELFLPGGGYPGEFVGFLPPSLRNQHTGKSWALEWPQAELLAAHLESRLESAGASATVAGAVVNALQTGRRYGQEA
jgi:hypothetical protein